MILREKLNLALELSGFSPPKDHASYRKIGNGAWHDAYLVRLADGEHVVVRLRKTVIYGRERPFDEQELREDYEPVRLYYRVANDCQPGLCPALYEYHLSPAFTYTVESYMGCSVDLSTLTVAQAHDYGCTVGRFFRAMHARPAPLPGYGRLLWNRHSLEAEDQRAPSEIRQAEAEQLRQQFDQLASSGLDLQAARHSLTLILDHDTIQPIRLINGDISTENLIIRRGQLAGLVDPVAELGSGTRYASFFVFCYRFLLPAMSNAPRYERHHFDRSSPVLSAVADGYLQGYGGDSVALRMEYFRWLLYAAHQNWQRLNAELDAETYLRAGSKPIIAARLQRCLAELEAFQVDG